MSVSATAAVSVLLAVLLALSGFFSAAETAYTGFSKARMKSLAKKDRRAALALGLTRNFGAVLTTLLIGNNIVNVAATTLAAVLFTAHFGDWGATLSTIVMTALVLVFGEVTPKTLAKERPEEFAAFSARAVWVCMGLFKPFCKLFSLWKKALQRIFKLNTNKAITEDEFRIMVSDAADGGAIPRDGEQLIEHALDYGEKRVSACMTGVEHIVCVGADEPPEAVERVFKGSGHRIIPVTRGGLQKVTGIVDEVDFLRFRLRGGSDLGEIVKPVMRCKPGDGISELFLRMRRERRHFALVCDGARVVGIITANDIVGELMGKVY